MSSEVIAIIIIIAMVGFMLLEVFLLSIASRKKHKAYVEEKSVQTHSDTKIENKSNIPKNV